jgi:hypothetical protein
MWFSLIESLLLGLASLGIPYSLPLLVIMGQNAFHGT